MHGNKLVVWFEDVTKHDAMFAGEIGATLGEMTREKFPVPHGFIVTSFAYQQFITENNLDRKIADLLTTIHFENADSVVQVAHHIQRLIVKGQLSEDVIKHIFTGYERLGGTVRDALVTITPSFTSSESESEKYTRQYEKFFNVHGEANLVQKIKEGWALLFDPQDIFYRHHHSINQLEVGMALIVQKMLESQKSGKLFTVDPKTQDKNNMCIEALYGMSEPMIQDATPDRYEIDKEDFTILEKIIGQQSAMLVKSGKTYKEIKIPKSESRKQKITDNQILELAVLGRKLEKLYYFPQRVDWVIQKNKVYILQTHAWTGVVKKNDSVSQIGHLPRLLTGQAASPGIASGIVKVIHSVHDVSKVVQGDVMVVSHTTKDFLPAMKKASAIITDVGGHVSHAAETSRTLGIPTVIGTEHATKVLKNGIAVTVDGIKGIVYKGTGRTSANSHIAVSTSSLSTTATKVYLTFEAFLHKDKLNENYPDGIGLVRGKLFLEKVGIHPKTLLHDGKKDMLGKEIVSMLEEYCTVMNPRPVIYSFSDLTSQEYRQLKGGQAYEPEEANPILGYRGAYRLLHDPEIFQLELEAIKHVRNKLNLKNLWISIPYVRSVNELVEIKKIISSSGLSRSSNFKLWMSIDVPANILMLEKYIGVGIDGVSIEPEHLTSLLLGTDGTNSEVISEFNIQSESVLWAIEKIMKISHKHAITTNFSGKDISSYPNLAENLVKWGVTSISVSPGSIEHTRHIISETEKKLAK